MTLALFCMTTFAKAVFASGSQVSKKSTFCYLVSQSSRVTKRVFYTVLIIGISVLVVCVVTLLICKNGCA